MCHPKIGARLLGSELYAYYMLTICLLYAHCMLILCLLYAYHTPIICLLHAFKLLYVYMQNGQVWSKNEQQVLKVHFGHSPPEPKK